jgi:hypothetical protein
MYLLRKDHPMTNPDVAEVERIARGLSHAGKRLICLMTATRWVKGTGFVHGSVVEDVLLLGLVDTQIGQCGRLVRLNDLGIRVRQYLSTPNGER